MNAFAFSERLLCGVAVLALMVPATWAAEEDIPPPPAPEYADAEVAEAVVSPEPQEESAATDDNKVIQDAEVVELADSEQTHEQVETTSDLEVPLSPEVVDLIRKVERLDASNKEAEKQVESLIRNRRITYSPTPPAWFVDPPKQKKDLRGPIVVKSDPCVTEAEMHQSFRENLDEATQQYINSYLGSQNAAMLVGYDLNRVRLMFGGPEEMYTGTLNSPSVGEMHQQGAVVHFDQAFRRELEKDWHAVVATARLGRVGMIGLGLLGLIATVFAYFKVDTATRGFYSGVLKLFAVSAAVGVLGFGVFAQKFFPWL